MTRNRHPAGRITKANVAIVVALIASFGYSLILGWALSRPATREDKIVQQAVVTILSAVYEEDFLGFSYGFRRGRGQHDALDALVVGIKSRNVNWILSTYDDCALLNND